MKIVGDYHTHSQYSHGQGDIGKNVEAAVRRGLSEIAITDHGPRAHSIIPLGIREPEVLLKIKEKIDTLNQQYSNINILTGVEANIINLSGDLDIPDEILARIDIVGAGLHLLIKPPDINTAYNLIFNNKITYNLVGYKRKEIRQWNTEAVINAVRRHNIDFITHPGYQLDIDTPALAGECADRGTYLEINNRHADRLEGFIKAAGRSGVKFILNSDAHHPDRVGDLREGIEVLIKTGLDLNRVVNVKH